MATDIMQLEITKIDQSRINSVDWDNLPFGKVFSDHMLIMDYKDGAWQKPSIQPFENLSLTPATSVLHYGQTIFEGMKAYKNKEGEVFLFRPEQNAKRFNQSATRMCMPEVPEDVFVDFIKTLVDIDRMWIPEKEGFSMYIRPFMIATDPYVGIRPSSTYKFMIFTCPVGSYYTEPVRVKIETEYTRAAHGGTGAAKAGGNYAASLYPAKLAQEQGYQQLIWTDAQEHKYIEEAGTMNVVFQIGNRIITPKSSDTILDGVTRKSVIQIARDWGYEIEERKVTVEEIITAIKNNELVDAFGAGTAATIAPIQTINFEGVDYELPDVPSRDFSNKVLEYLNLYKHGKTEDKFNWIVKF
jgi:branched-chain amino acid aminotransferase